jgi:hypothetical protein
MAKIAESNERMSDARSYYYKSLESYENAKVPFDIAKAMHNTACFEFRMNNYETSRTLFEKSLPILKNHSLPFELISIKDYCKTLIRLGEDKTAAHVLSNTLNKPFLSDTLYLKAKLLILMSIATRTPEHAINVLELDVDWKLKSYACEFLMEFYNQQGDSHSMMKYYRINANIKHLDLLSEEEL